MTITKIGEVLTFYHHYMDEVKNCSPLEIPNDPSNYSHLMWMCDKCEFEFLQEMVPDVPISKEDVEKSMRWLGFIQGCLLCKGDFTLEQLRAHSRSEPEAKE